MTAKKAKKKSVRRPVEVAKAPAKKKAVKKPPARSRKKVERWELRMYIAGRTARSDEALANLEAICEQHVPGRYRIEVIDLLVNPALASGDQILAVPTLVRRLPPPMKLGSGRSRCRKLTVGSFLKGAPGRGSWTMVLGRFSHRK